MYTTAAVVAFVLIVVPTIVLLAVWAAVTALRILFPERPLPFLKDPVEERRRRTAAGEAVPVGFREIHEEMPVHVRSVATPYRFDRERVLAGLPGHVPDVWVENVCHRRN